MKKPIILSATLPNKKVIYVSSFDKREDGKLIAIPTFIQREAKIFDSEQDAADIIPYIHNPLDRNWKVEGIERKGKKSIVNDKTDLV